MKFAKIVFLIAGVYGIVAIAPMYFMEQRLVENSQKVFNHPEFFYGFLGVTLSWQLAFIVISRDPGRYRLLMYPACLEKMSFVLAIAFLYLQNRVGMNMVFAAGIDFVLLVLFVVSIFKLKGDDKFGKTSVSATEAI